jgi:hypothetical protein
MTTARRLLVAALAVAALLALASPASAAVRTATDRRAGVAFRLDGRVLTLRLLPSAPRSVRRELRGGSVLAACFSDLARADAGVVVLAQRDWPRGRAVLRVRFPLDVSRLASGCSVGSGEGDPVAQVVFRRAPRFTG